METPGNLGNPTRSPKEDLAEARRRPALSCPSKFPMVTNVSFNNESVFAQDFIMTAQVAPL